MIAHAIRAYKPTDLAIVLDAWHKSYYDYCSVGWIPVKFYNRVYRAYLEHLLLSNIVTVSLAVMPEDHDQVLGWAVSTGDSIHYIYVKQLYRKMGLAKSLIYHIFDELLPEKVKVSHWPRFHGACAERLQYNPALFYTDEALHWLRKAAAQQKVDLSNDKTL